MQNITVKICLCILLLTIFCIPTTVVGYGGGGGGGSGDGANNTADPFAGMEPLASGGVTWTPNPNGANVRGSSIWSERPENIQQGPYQPDKAVEDAEQELLTGFQSGNYTPQQVKEQLEWAQQVGITLSPQAVKTLEAINHPPAPSSPPPTTSNTSRSSRRNEKQNEKAAEIINVLNAVSQAVKNKGSASDIENAAIGAIVQNKLNKWLSK